MKEIDDMVLQLPAEDKRDDAGVWRLQRKFTKDKYTKLPVPYMEWKVLNSFFGVFFIFHLCKSLRAPRSADCHHFIRLGSWEPQSSGSLASGRSPGDQPLVKVPEDCGYEID